MRGHTCADVRVGGPVWAEISGRKGVDEEIQIHDIPNADMGIVCGDDVSSDASVIRAEIGAESE